MDLPHAQPAALAAAVAQLELTVRESAGPVQVVGESFDSLSLGLTQLRQSAEGADLETVQAIARRLTADLSLGFEALQFYDRMVQRLQALQDFLAGFEPHASVSALREPSEHWERLRSVLRRRLMNESQRELLDLLLPNPASDVFEDLPSAAPAEPSIELF